MSWTFCTLSDYWPAHLVTAGLFLNLLTKPNNILSPFDLVVLILFLCFFRIAVKYSREALEKFSQDSAIDGEHGDLIPYLLSKTALSEREVLTIICEFIFAGVDTVSELMHCSNYQTQMSWKVLSVPKNRSVCLLCKHLIPYQGPLMSSVLPRDPLSVHL